MRPLGEQRRSPNWMGGRLKSTLKKRGGLKKNRNQPGEQRQARKKPPNGLKFPTPLSSLNKKQQQADGQAIEAEEPQLGTKKNFF